MASPATPAPEGYSWIEMKEINGAFLKPEGWHFSFNKGKLMGSFSISQDKPRIDASVGVRFFAYAVSNLSKIDSRLVSERIPQYVGSISGHKDYDLAFSENITRGSYSGMSIRYQFETVDGALMRQQAYLADDEADLLLVIIFESPTQHWDQSWETGRVLFDSFILN